jgi:hypothetical protein
LNIRQVLVACQAGTDKQLHRDREYRMTQSSQFTSTLTDDTRNAFDCVVDLGLRVWQPLGVHQTVDDGLVHLFYITEGILGCEPMPYPTRVLPREVIRVGGSDERSLENPSRSDTTTAVHLTLRPTDSTPLSTRHHYFSDDQKDNKLCRIGARERDGRTLAIGAPVDVYLTTLGRYDTVLLDRHAHQSLLIMCPRGKVSLDTIPVTAGDAAIAVKNDTATVVGLGPCTVLIIRSEDATT